jgi:hypothetical protein
MALATWLSIAGLGADFLGAALLAYDALYGPRARVQAAERRTRLALATEKQERLLELSRSQSDSEPDAAQFRLALSALDRAIAETTAELRHWETHEQRSQRCAVEGLALLMVGFACQVGSSILANVNR